MKKLVTLLTTLALVVSMGTVSLATSNSSDMYNPDTGKSNQSTETTTSLPCYGRFVVEDCNIDVALYNSHLQSVCDAVDSACFYHFKGIDGMTIADHNFQAFRTLTSVTVGTKGYIYESSGGIIYVECVEVCDGTNTKSGLICADGSFAKGKYDYLTYTCLDSKGVNIRICQWAIIGVSNIDTGFEKGFDIDKRTSKLIKTIMKSSSVDLTNGKNNKKNK